MTDDTTSRPASPAAPRPPRRTAGRSASRRTLGVVLGALAVLLLVGGIVAALSLRGRGGGEGMVFVIPANTVVEQPTIDSAIAIPTDIRFKPGENATIVIRNEDRIAHRAGPWVVGPGQTFTQRFPDPGEYFMACSVDPAESVTVTVEG